MTFHTPAAHFDSALKSCDSSLTEWVCSFNQGLGQQKIPDTDLSQLTIREHAQASALPQVLKWK